MLFLDLKWLSKNYKKGRANYVTLHIHSFFKPFQCQRVQHESDFMPAGALLSGYIFLISFTCGFAFGHAKKTCFRVSCIPDIWHLKG